MVGHQEAGRLGGSITKAVLAELLVELGRVAVNGVVPEGAFLAQVRRLGLGVAEGERLRQELARLNMPVQKTVVHADVDPSEAEKVVSSHGGDASSRLDRVRALLGRYADTEGYVTSRAVEGVVRLAGLTPHEAADLRAVATVRGNRATVPETRPGAVEGGRRTEEDGADWEDEPVPDLPTGTGTEVPADGDFATAVAAARLVLEEDRYRPRPEKRLLAAEEEVGLTVLLRGGADRVADEPDKETLSKLPPDDLRIRARDCLVLHNQGLVHKMVPRYLEQGLDYEDLFQHGVLGLMTATRKFDPVKGFKFSTYATWWVRQSITRAIADEGALIRVPVHMHEQMRKVALAERTLLGQGRPAGVVDVAVFCDMTVKKVEEVRRLSRRTDSLDRVIGDGATLGDFVEETQPLPPIDHLVLNRVLLAQVMTVVGTFSGRDHRILVRRLGLDGDEPSTLDELGGEFGVTRERIRQLEVKLRPELQDRLRNAGLVGGHGAGGDAPGKERRKTAQLSGNTEKGAAGRRQGKPARQHMQRDAGSGDRPSRLTRAGRQARPSDVVAPTGAGVGAGPADDRAKPIDARQHSADPATAPGGRHESSPPTEAVPPTSAGLGASVAIPGPEQSDAPPVRSVPAEPAARREQLTPELSGAEPQQPTVAADSSRDADASGAWRSRTTGTRSSKPTVSAVKRSPSTEAPRATAGWETARRMSAPLGAGVTWLAEYALTALGPTALAVLLGQSAAEAVKRAAKQRGMLDRPVVTALEVLQRVLDTVKERGQRPEDFFERPAEVLMGVTPRAYLARQPLVRSESRLAVRDALREFAAVSLSREDAVALPSETAEDTGSEPVAPMVRTEEKAADQQPEAAEEVAAEEVAGQPQEQAAQADDNGPGKGDGHLDEIRREHEARIERLEQEHGAQLALLRQEHERLLEAERRAADTRLASARADTDRQLDALERALLHRADTLLLRREEQLHAQAEERATRLREEQREEHQAVLRRAEQAETAAAAALRRAQQAEEVARSVAEDADSHRQRADDADQRLRRIRDEAEARIAALEARATRAETALANRKRAVQAARQHAEAVEQRAAQYMTRAHEQAGERIAQAERQAAERIAQAEQEAEARITELREQLAEAAAAATGRVPLRDRWRRS